MRILIFCLACYIVSTVQEDGIISIKNSVDNLANGVYSFKYEIANGILREETGKFEGDGDEKTYVVSGSYSFTGPDGKIYSVTFRADDNGYRPIIEKQDQISRNVDLANRRFEPNLVASLLGR